MEATNALIETKRLVDKMDYDIQVTKTRIGIRESQGPDGEGVAGDAMDVDEEAVGEDGRAQSVASGRSGRSRKQVS